MSYALVFAVIGAALLTLILSPTDRRRRVREAWPPPPVTDPAVHIKVAAT